MMAEAMLYAARAGVRTPTQITGRLLNLLLHPHRTPVGSDRAVNRTIRHFVEDIGHHYAAALL